MMTETTEPRAWVGCLACYNSGRLVGQWVEGIEAGDTDSETIHGIDSENGQELLYSHEELWVFDHEGYGPTLRGECSPTEAQVIAETLAEISDDERPAFFAYVAVAATPSGPVDEILDDFREAYCGEWSSLAEFAAELASEIGAVPSDAEWPLRHIDWEDAARELEMGGDYFVVGHHITETYRGMPVGGVYVFRANI